MAEGAVIRFGRVTNIKDPHGAGRIQVRTTFDNIIKNDEELPYYFPLLPKMLHIMPKVGEGVFVVSPAPGEFDNFNYYIGPIISQEDKLFYEKKDYALRFTETSDIGWGPNPYLKKGVTPTLYPAPEDISIEGRKDTGIQLKDEEVRIKAGVKVVNPNYSGTYNKGLLKVLPYSGPKNNTESPAFISLKYYPDNDYKTDGFKSTATIVADKINLIGTHTTDPATKEIPVTENKDMNAEDKDNLISDSAMKELINKAHQIPYGDKLIEFLDILRVAFAKHVHPFPTMAPCNDENMKAVATYDLKGTLSDNVRIN